MFVSSNSNYFKFIQEDLDLGKRKGIVEEHPWPDYDYYYNYDDENLEEVCIVCIVLYYIVLYCIVLYYTVLYCIVLYCIVS